MKNKNRNTDRIET